jgi:endonuclease/exonuclease/phosphatase family metal-dependent hydrolase
MPPFKKPTVRYSYDVSSELRALRAYERTKEGRDIPDKAANRLLLATWNIANLGVQERTDADYRLIAEMIGWFDLVAVQESNDHLAGIYAILDHLPNSYRLLFSNAAGNHERLTFVYDSKAVSVLEKVGEVTVPPVEIRAIKLPGVRQTFQGFDRSPYIGSFQANKLRFLLVNAHLYFGSEKKASSIDRRCLEAYAIARWADEREKNKNAFSRDIIVLGDFNLPKVDVNDRVYQALTKRGLHLPDHSTRIGSSVASDSAYDQIAFFPGSTGAKFTGQSGVFDFDGALFHDLWTKQDEKKNLTPFLDYVKYHISDHRLLWAQFRTA